MGALDIREAVSDVLNRKTTLRFYSSIVKKKSYFSLISEFSKIDCRVDITVRGSTTKCLDGGVLSSCKCRRVVAVLTVHKFPTLNLRRKL